MGKLVSTVIDLNGEWKAGGPQRIGISVSGSSITINMSAFGRPTAHGSVINNTTIQVNFPDDRTYTAELVPPNTIRWSNNTAWTKLPQAFNIIHTASGLFLDSHEIEERDFNVVLRPRQDNDSQRWIMTRAEEGYRRIQQVSSGRFLDAHEYSGKDFRVVTRPRQDNRTQLWSMSVIDAHNRFILRQISSQRFLDAYVSESQDYQVVTRPEKADFKGQLWIFPGSD